MTIKETELKIPKGIHLRVAGALARKANNFDSEIFIEHNNINVNCKSVMGIATLGAMMGDILIVSVNGDDEIEALLSICSFLENNDEDMTSGEIFDKYISGASWMDDSGVLYIVKGFHQDWVDNNSESLNGAKSVKEVISGLNWINIMIYRDESIEFHAKDLGDSVLNRVSSFLGELKFDWSSAHIFTSEKDSVYIKFDRKTFDQSGGDLKSLVKENRLETQYF